MTTKHRLNLVFDLDGVLVDFAGGFRKKFGRWILHGDGEISRDEWQEINSSDFWQTLPPLEGAKLLKDLSPLGNMVYVLTARDEKKTKKKTHEWLTRNGIALPRENVLFSNPASRKLDFMRQLAPAHLIDDYLPTVAIVAKEPKIDATLLLQPYNEEAARSFPDVQTAKSVKEFLEKVKG